MPQTINGIGTWYYGKRHLHSMNGTCEFCGSYETLSSYDTTKYIVVLFVPIVPLGQIHIMQECPRCQRHRFASLKQWEKSKKETIAGIMQKIENDDDDVEGVCDAIRVAIGYQDVKLLDQVAEHLARPMTHSFEVQSLLGIAYGYFSNSKEAEAAFRAVLAVKPDDPISRMLSVEILRQGRPNEAAPLLRHIIEQQDIENIGNVYLLVEGFQAQGDHVQAIEWLKQCEQTFPQLKEDHEFQAIQKAAERQAKTGLRVPSPSLARSKNFGGEESGLDLAKWIGPTLAVLALVAYFYAAFHYGQHRDVHLISGLKKPYAVIINGQRHDLPPLSLKKIQVPEGELDIASADENFPLERSTVRVETSFFLRPFLSRTFVLNPDQTAVITWQKSAYGRDAVGLPDPEISYHTNSALHQFSGIDYVFEPFPHSIKVKGGATVFKTGVEKLATKDYDSQLLMMLLRQEIDPQSLVDYVAKRLRLEPDDDILVGFLSSQMKPEKFIEQARPQLAKRPLMLTWHRTYQDATERFDPQYDLHSEYQKLLDADPTNPDLTYLLSRVTEDPDVVEQLVTKAATADPPSAYGLLGMSLSKLNTGDFKAALKYGELALQRQPSEVFRHALKEVWLANGKYDQIAEFNRQSVAQNTNGFLSVITDVNLLVQRGDFPEATARIQKYRQEILAQATRPDSAKMVEMYLGSITAIVAYAQGDFAEYERLLTAAHPGEKTFAVSFTAGRWEEAAETLAQVEKSDDRWPNRLLLYLAYHAANNKDAADKQLQLAIADLQQDEPQYRRLAVALSAEGKSSVPNYLRLPINPAEKRIVLAALGTRFPNDRAPYFKLAARLNYEKTMPYWFLKKYLEAPPP